MPGGYPIGGCALASPLKHAELPMSRTILFLCPHAAAKSVMAAALCAREAAARGLDVATDAAGTEPDPEVNPRVVSLMAAEGIDVSRHRPRRVTPEALSRAWRVVSLGCDVSAMLPRGVHVERWDEVPLPSADLRGCRDGIHARVNALAAALAHEARPVVPAGVS